MGGDEAAAAAAASAGPSVVGVKEGVMATVAVGAVVEAAG